MKLVEGLSQKATLLPLLGLGGSQLALCPRVTTAHHTKVWIQNRFDE